MANQEPVSDVMPLGRPIDSSIGLPDLYGSSRYARPRYLFRPVIAVPPEVFTGDHESLVRSVNSHRSGIWLLANRATLNTLFQRIGYRVDPTATMFSAMGYFFQLSANIPDGQFVPRHQEPDASPSMVSRSTEMASLERLELESTVREFGALFDPAGSTIAGITGESLADALRAAAGAAPVVLPSPTVLLRPDANLDPNLRAILDEAYSAMSDHEPDLDEPDLDEPEFASHLDESQENAMCLALESMLGGRMPLGRLPGLSISVPVEEQRTVTWMLSLNNVCIGRIELHAGDSSRQPEESMRRQSPDLPGERSLDI